MVDTNQTRFNTCKAWNRVKLPWAACTKAAKVSPKLVAMKVHNALGASCHERSTSKTEKTKISAPYKASHWAQLTKKKRLEIETNSNTHTTDIGVQDKGNLRSAIRL